MGFLSSIFTWQHFINLLDIGVVWYAIYKLMMLLRGTKAVQLFKGVLVIIVIKLISWYLGLRTVSWITDQIINWGIIAIIVIFQPEIRRGLEHLGRGSLFFNNKKKQKFSNQKFGAVLSIWDADHCSLIIRRSRMKPKKR